MIPTDTAGTTGTAGTTETWVCRTCASVNAGWRLRCERCGVIVRSSTSWGPPLPQSAQQPPPTAPKPRGGVTTALSVVGCLAIGAVGVGAAGVGYLAFQRAEERRTTTDERLESPPTTQADTRFFAADSQFRAEFPGPPIRSTEPIDVDGVARDMTLYMTNVNLEVFLVGSFDLPPGSVFDPSTAADIQDGTIERASATTWQGFDAVDMLMTESDGMRMQMLAVLTPKRVYVVGVASEDDPTAAYDAFKASFEITL